MAEESEVKRLAERLPQSLICMTLEMNLEDLDAIEQYLADAPESTGKCLPLAVRNVILASMLDPSWQRLAPGPSSTGIAIAERLDTIPYPDAKMTLTYLTALWRNANANYPSTIDFSLFRTAIKQGLPYLVTYVLARGLNIDTYPALNMITDKYSDDTMEHILSRLTPADIDVISVLLRAGADISDSNYAVLRGSATYGYHTLSALLLDRLLGPYRERRETLPDNIKQLVGELLPKYAFNGDEESVALIMQFNISRERLISALHAAIIKDRINIIRYLLDRLTLSKEEISGLWNWLTLSGRESVMPEVMQLLRVRYKSM